MDRRKFFKNGSLFTIGAAVLNPFDSTAKNIDFDTPDKNKKAKNIILLVSDGMSTGTLNMADLYLNRKTGKGCELPVMGSGRLRSPFSAKEIKRHSCPI